MTCSRCQKPAIVIHDPGGCGEAVCAFHALATNICLGCGARWMQPARRAA